MVEGQKHDLREEVQETTLKLLDYCKKNDWAGYDPYDALNSKLFTALPFLDFRLSFWVGMGIPISQQDKIFSKMFRADNVRMTDTQGTGLGLYIVKQILDQSGGNIFFESREKEGTTFHIKIPLSGMRKKSGTKALA